MVHKATIDMIKGKGPSRETLFAALGSWHANGRLLVTFVLNGHAQDVASVHPLPMDKDEIRLVAQVEGIEWEDGSGKSFNLKGYAVRIEGQVELISRSFTAYYHTDKRSGNITFELR